MAITQDYVTRLMEMMEDLFRRLADEPDEHARLRALDEVCRDQCGLSMDAACALSLDTLENLLPPQGLFLLSELTWGRAALLTENEEDRAVLLLRALRLLSGLSEEEPLCVARCARLREMMDACEAQLTAEDYFRCARFFMAGERFDDGEDAVFLALECAEDPGSLARQGEELFQALLKLPDGTLIPGGLPREDVEQAIQDLKSWEKT